MYLSSLLNCKRASVGIFDLQKNDLIVFAVNIDDKRIVESDYILKEEVFKEIDKLRDIRIEIVEDISRMASHSSVSLILQTKGIRSFISVPLVSATGLYGFLNVGWEDPKTFTLEEMEIAGEVAGQITIAIEQDHLRKETIKYAADLEERVRVRTVQLEDTIKELEAFTYSVSHDLRAPLRHINGYVELLTERYDNSLSEKGKHYLESIADSAQQMGTLIDDLLQFSRTGRQEMRQADLDMNNILQEVLDTMKQDIKGRNIEWDIAALPFIYGDRSLLSLVWSNLMNNAVKFTRSKKKAIISVGYKEKKKEYVFFVRDNGAGFDMQYADKLFGVFQRLHSSQDFEGTGIGLANVRRIILKHGGRTWADAKLDKGAVFYFSLPKRVHEEKAGNSEKGKEVEINKV